MVGRPWRAAVLAFVAIAVFPASGAVRLEVRDGRPIVNGVFVNGHGPYRFLIDTGTTINIIEAGLARKLGMSATFEDIVHSSLGQTPMPGSDGNLIELGRARAEKQRFQFSKLESLQMAWPDVRGVLGQWFLSGFDYTLDLRRKMLEFGKRERAGNRVQFRLQEGRSALATSLGDLVMDSGAPRLILFGVEPSVASFGEPQSMLTLTGSQSVGTVWRKLLIEGRHVWRGDAVALPNRSEDGIAGLMPLSLFKSIYICNSERYVVLE